MNEQEKIKFNDFMRKFSKEQLVGWLSAIAFIMSTPETNKKLCDKLSVMYDICSSVIAEMSQREVK